MNKNMTVFEMEKILGDRARLIVSNDLTPEQRAEENAQTALIIGVAKQFLNGADLVLRTEALKAKTKSLKESRMDKLIGDYEE